MSQDNEIIVCEKPEDMSFDVIHQILWSANEKNRQDGFILTTSNISGEEIKNKIGKDGKCFVAMDGDRPVGTVAVRYVKRKAWYAKGIIANPILASVLPEYQGKHVYLKLSNYMFDYVKAQGYPFIEIDTAENNKRPIKVYQRQGFRLVGYKANPGGDHYSVIMVKWFGKAPYSSAYCTLRYMIKRALIRRRYNPDKTSRSRASDRKLNNSIKTAVAQYRALHPEYTEQELKQDMLAEYRRGRAEPFEYCRYDFRGKDEKERRTYFFDRERRKYFSKQWNIFPRNKYERYLLFKDLFRREILHVTFDRNEEEAYQAFIGRHPKFIVKPAEGVKGKGIRILSAKEAKDLSSLRERVGGECILEEIIVQGEELAAFHPASVNTLRIVTVFTDEQEAQCLYALFRTGQGDSIVDNVGSGGIISMVDQKNGQIITDGMRGVERFECHPDTRKRFCGFTMPGWEEALSLVLEAHKSLPEQKLIGWDLAWTDRGWDVVEANPSPSFESIQVLSGKGLRPALQAAFKALK